MKTLCPHCGQDLDIRNPSGYCDHLYYPDYCAVCAKIRKDHMVRRKPAMTPGAFIVPPPFKSMGRPDRPRTLPPDPPPATFQTDVEILLNRHGLDSDCNTPDYVLAQFVVDSLEAYGRAVKTLTGDGY